MRIGEIIREGERELPQWEPNREPTQPEPKKMPLPEPEKSPEKVT
jgi:hypothetical protein